MNPASAPNNSIHAFDFVNTLYSLNNPEKARCQSLSVSSVRGIDTCRASVPFLPLFFPLHDPNSAWVLSFTAVAGIIVRELAS
jgi:hypothetical protein